MSLKTGLVIFGSLFIMAGIATADAAQKEKLPDIKTHTPLPNVDAGCGKGMPVYEIAGAGKVCKIPVTKQPKADKLTAAQEPYNPLDDLPKFPEKLL